MSGNNLLLREDDEDVVRTSLSFRDVAVECVNGCYTTMRTCDHGRVLLLEKHLARLLKSSAILGEPKPFESTEDVYNRIIGPLRRILRESLKIFPDSDYTIGVFLTRCENQQGPCHLTLFLKRWDFFNGSVAVEIWEGMRKNPEVKHLEWVRDRRVKEERITGRVNEIVMMSHDGTLSEGLTSNFFVFYRDGSIRTAPADVVLRGTVRDIVLDSCRVWNIPVVLKAPRVDELEEWKGVFITSTSRLVLPIDSVQVFTLPDAPTFKFSFEDETLLKMKNEVTRIVNSMGTNVLS